jgi:hypothetical protein
MRRLESKPNSRTDQISVFGILCGPNKNQRRFADFDLFVFRQFVLKKEFLSTSLGGRP